MAVILLQIVLGLHADDKLQHFKCVNHREIKAEIGLLLFLPPENKHHIFCYWCLEANSFLPLHCGLVFAHIASSVNTSHRLRTPTLLNCSLVELPRDKGNR